MKSPKIQAAINFLKLDSDGNLADIHDSQIDALENVLRQASSLPRKTDTVADVLCEGCSDDGALLELTYLAEFGDKRVAADACLKLAGMYSGVEEIPCISGPDKHQIEAGCWDEIALGYIDHDDYMKILAAKDEAAFEHWHKR